MCKKCDELVNEVPESSTPIDVAYTNAGRVSLHGTPQQIEFALAASTMVLGLFDNVHRGGVGRLLEFVAESGFGGDPLGSAALMELFVSVMNGDPRSTHEDGLADALRKLMALAPREGEKANARLKWMGRTFGVAFAAHLGHEGVRDRDPELADAAFAFAQDVERMRQRAKGGSAHA